MKVVIRTSGTLLAEYVETADSLLARLKGLLGRQSLQPGHALWLRPCNGIHTFGMRFPIDVVVLDRRMRVHAIHASMQPNCMTRLYPAGSSVLELPSGTIDKSGLSVEDTLIITP